MTSTIHEAYARVHRYGPEFGGDDEGHHGMTNHAPMAAEVWLDRYVCRLDERRPPIGDRIDDWRAALGDSRRRPSWTEFFARQLREQEWTDVLVRWWPRLLPGMAASSTHGVMRVGHAVRTLRADPSPEARAELANGLAFWATGYRRLPASAGEVPLDAGTALQRIPRLPDRIGFTAGRLGQLAPSRRVLRPPTR